MFMDENKMDAYDLRIRRNQLDNVEGNPEHIEDREDHNTALSEDADLELSIS